MNHKKWFGRLLNQENTHRQLEGCALTMTDGDGRFVIGYRARRGGSPTTAMRPGTGRRLEGVPFGSLTRLPLGRVRRSQVSVTVWWIVHGDPGGDRCIWTGKNAQLMMMMMAMMRTRRKVGNVSIC